jgi:predicted CXXCH cytochrome family protein
MTRATSPLSCLALVVAVIATFATPLAAHGQPDQPASGEGAAVCLKCHENPVIMEIVDTPHANFKDPRSPASREQCESCHGPSGTHVNFPMQVGNIRFTKHGKTSIAERNQTCLECHNKGDTAHWSEGVHAEKLQCGNCHLIHKSKQPAPVVKAAQNDRCTECHPKVVPSAPIASNHPLEGDRAITCTQCHTPHGKTSLTPCIDCHPQDAQTLARQTPKAQDYHARGIDQKVDCTACHKGFVHAMPQISNAAPDAHR